MGNFLKDAIKKGIGDAVGKAVEAGVNAVAKPKIEQAAANASNKVASKIEQVASELVGEVNTAAGETQQAVNDLNAAVTEMNGGEPVKPADLSGLGSLFGSYVNAATSFATTIANNMKECPKCHEIVAGDLAFCPHCGGKLPEKTIGAELVCPECGFQNTIETKFCAKCGAKLSGLVEKEKQFREEFKQKLPNYPVWMLDCYDASFENEGIDDYGDPYCNIYGESINYENWEAYKIALKDAGFDDNGRKEINGKIYAVDFVDGLGFNVDHSDKNEEKKDKKSSIFDKAKEIKGNLDDAKDTAKDIINFFKK